MQTWILPSELSWLTFSYLSSRSLSNAFLVCKGWHLLINQEAFFKYYARSCSIHELTPGFFLRFFEHFRAEQLFQINSGRITRLDIQGIQETEKNRTSLRVAKLVTSLNWFQAAVITNAPYLINLWHPMDPKNALRFKEGRDYMHLYILGESAHFEKELQGGQKAQDISEEINDLMWEEKRAKLESIIARDYVSLNTMDPDLLEALFQAVFNKYEIKEIMSPRDHEAGFFKLPDPMFKSFFTAWTVKYLSKSFIEAPAYKMLCIQVQNDKQFFYFGEWLEKTKVAIQELHIFIGDHNKNLSSIGICAFRKSLGESEVKMIKFHGTPTDECSLFLP